MPRPGSRPYDCVRRAWHSDRDQPIRGTLIQEIFRIVNKIHGSTTRKNKEFQEKLPVVVLRVEEIIYSKANSEAEYKDLKTLEERANDAINTIIRLDEDAETGEYLPPCIEAALNLGCPPKKASRSERNCPRSYLSPTIQEPPSGGDHAINSHMSNCLTFVNSLKSTHLGSEYQPYLLKNEDSILNTNTLPFVSKNISSTCNNQSLEHHQPSNLFSVYPLYYGHRNQFAGSQQGPKVPDRPVSNTSGTATMEVVENHLASNFKAPNQISRPFIIANPVNPRASGCDLSLRLGPLSIPALNVENGQTSLKDKKFSSFGGDRAYGTLDCYSNKCGFQGESLSEQATMAGKRKAYFGEPVKNQKLCLPP